MRKRRSLHAVPTRGYQVWVLLGDRWVPRGAPRETLDEARRLAVILWSAGLSSVQGVSIIPTGSRPIRSD
jgi:hypothetical protein